MLSSDTCINSYFHTRQLVRNIQEINRAHQGIGIWLFGFAFFIPPMAAVGAAYSSTSQIVFYRKSKKIQKSWKNNYCKSIL